MPLLAGAALALTALLIASWMAIPPRNNAVPSAPTVAPPPQAADPVPPAPAPPDKTLAHQQGALLQEHLESGRRWIADTAPRYWFLQLFSADGDKPELVEAYLTDIKAGGMDMDLVRVYLSDLSGRLRYGVIYGEFTNQEEAQRAARKLPQSIRAGRPYPRQAQKLQ